MSLFEYDESSRPTAIELKAQLMSIKKDEIYAGQKIDELSQQIREENRNLTTAESENARTGTALTATNDKLQAETKKLDKLFKDFQGLQDNVCRMRDIVVEKYSEMFDRYEKLLPLLDGSTRIELESDIGGLREELKPLVQEESELIIRKERVFQDYQTRLKSVDGLDKSLVLRLKEHADSAYICSQKEKQLSELEFNRQMWSDRYTAILAEADKCQNLLNDVEQQNE